MTAPEPKNQPVIDISETVMKTKMVVTIVISIVCMMMTIMTAWFMLKASETEFETRILEMLDDYYDEQKDLKKDYKYLTEKVAVITDDNEDNKKRITTIEFKTLSTHE